VPLSKVTQVVLLGGTPHVPSLFNKYPGMQTVHVLSSVQVIQLEPQALQPVLSALRY